MKIGIDSGSFCGPKVGNYIFTENLIKAIEKYDKKNNYYLYSFCSKPKNLHTAKNLTYKKLVPNINWINWAVRFEEYNNKKNLFLGLNQAFPKSSSKKILFSHGLSFLFFKHFYKDSYEKMYLQLKSMIKLSDYLVVSSIKVKKELENLSRSKNKIKVIKFGIPFDFQSNNSIKKQKYFLNVGMNHPIKNVSYIVDCFKKFNLNNKNIYKLYLISNKRYPNIKDKKIIQISNITRYRLKKLYQGALVYLSPSLYESFNFPVLEALSQKTPVIALKSSIIPELAKYVDIVTSKKDFIKKMADSINKKPCIDQVSLKRDFSWKKYMSELKKLYRL
ncbi:MAG: glycosyltransferase [bacterium]